MVGLLESRDDVTLAECERKQGIICRNIGAFSNSDCFRAYSKVRWSTTGNRRNSGGGWVELSALRKQNVNMDILWFQQVLKRGYVKILDASEMAVLEHLMDMDLRIEASRSYGDYKKRYKRVCKAKAKKVGNKPVPSKGKVVV